VLTCLRCSWESISEVFEVMTQVDHDLTIVNRFDQHLGLIKSLGRHSSDSSREGKHNELGSHF
jgi:hypothetical protein